MDEASLVSRELAPQAAAAIGDRVVGASVLPHAPLHRYFNAVPGDAVQESQLKMIWDFAANRAGTEDMEAVYREVDNLRHMLGSNKLGDKPWMKIVSYIVAVTDLKQAETTIRHLTS